MLRRKPSPLHSPRLRPRREMALDPHTPGGCLEKQPKASKPRAPRGIYPPKHLLSTCLEKSSPPLETPRQTTWTCTGTHQRIEISTFCESVTAANLLLFPVACCVIRHCEIASDDTMFLAPAEKNILEKLVWPLRHAKGSYLWAAERVRSRPADCLFRG